jgi:ankyrin repeat protein
MPVGGRTDIPTEDQHTGLDIARELLERGANPDIQLKLRPPYRNTPFDRGDNNSLITGATPLLRAAKASDDEAVKLLLQYGAKVDLANVMDVTPFLSAAGVDQSNNPTRGRYKTDEDAVKTVKILVEAGADIHRHAGIYRDYLEPYTDPQSKFKRTAYDGQTALHGAAKKGWNKTITYLAGLGLDLEARDAMGRTPLDLAYGRYEPAFNDAQAAPLTDTIALLADLCHKEATCHLSREAGL